MAKQSYEWLDSRSREVFNRAAGFAITAATAPVLVGGLVAATIDNRGNPFFVQNRVGEEGVFGKPFRFWKLKTMVSPDIDIDHITPYIEFADHGLGGQYDETDFFVNLLQEIHAGRQDSWNTQGTYDTRATKTGQFLRKRSIDELPQTYAWAFGKTSTVGIDRDMLDEDLARRREADPRLFDDLWYPAYKKYRGGTGWAQITRHDQRGPMSVIDDYKAMLAGEMWLNEASFSVDSRIVAETIPCLMKPDREYAVNLRERVQERVDQLQRAA